jgi:hypothetical protein
MQIQRALPLIVLALSTGCATLNEKECRVVDWGELGRVDGAAGYESTRLAAHAEACSRFGIAPDTLAYRAGREEGLHQYCTPDNALQQGLKGASYHQVCAGEAGQMFVAVYARGRSLRVIQDDMQEMQHRFDSERNAQAEVKDLDMYKRMDQNLRYFEREKIFMQHQYDQALFAINSGFDPAYYDEGGWQEGIPYPKVLREVGKKN